MIGRENLTTDGPVIFVSNHPNAFLDPLIFLMLQRQKLHFIAGAEWFGKGLKSWIFRTQFNMIPVIRPWLKTGKEKSAVNNEEMFINCYRCLADDCRIVIYPEGTSMTITKVRDLKTGASRIKLGADKYMKSDKKVSIIPIGLNYNSPHNFQSDVVINIGQPIDFSDLPDESDEKKQVRNMTDRIHEKMTELVLHFEDEDFTPFARKVSRLFGSTVMKELEIADHEIERKFRLRKGILDAINYFQENDKVEFEGIKDRIERYFESLDKLKIDARFMGSTATFPYTQTLAYVAGLPFFLIGFILNAIPFFLTRYIFNSAFAPKFSVDHQAGKLNPSFIGSMAFLLGMGIFTLWYVLIAIILYIIFGFWWIIPIILFAGYFSGIFSMRFARLKYHLTQKRKLYRQLKTGEETFTNVLNEREILIQEMKQFKARYDMASPPTAN